MATFAVMNNSTVFNVIVADTKEIAEQVTGLPCIEYTEANPAGIGWTYDEATSTFIDPNAATPEATPEA